MYKALYYLACTVVVGAMVGLLIINMAGISDEMSMVAWGFLAAGARGAVHLHPYAFPPNQS